MKTLYVAADGNDANTGTKSRPLQTLDAARNALRRLSTDTAGHATVRLQPGTYTRTKPFKLTARDSNVRYVADGGEVRLAGGRAIPAEAWRAVEDAAVLARLDPAARPHVVQADLRALGVKDLGDPVALGARPELFFNDRPMTLARWPNEGFTAIADLSGERPIKSHGLDGDAVGKFTGEGDRAGRWADEPDLWLHGYWFWDWADSFERVTRVDARTGRIETAQPYHHYGYRKGQRFYALNALCELDMPGEWYVDRRTGTLYFWPPERINKRSRVVLSILTAPIVEMKNASDVHLCGLTLETTRGCAVKISGGARDRIEDCVVRNTGADGVVARGGAAHEVRRCDIYNTGATAIVLSGGNRKRLTPAGHRAVDNHIYGFARLKRTYSGAIHLSGVGNHAAHNFIHHAPHLAILFGGNDHVIEFNEVQNVCEETGDVGVFYTGRDWTMQGNVIRCNFVHDVHGPGLWGAQVVYLDDAASGSRVEKNVIFRCARAMLIGGGRDNVVENNLMIACDESVVFDNRGMNWMADHVNPGGVMQERLKDVPYRRKPWAARYPHLVGILDDDPATPKGNVIRHNVIQDAPPMKLAPEVEAFGTVENNWVTDQSVGVRSARRMDFRLAAGAPVFRHVPGFKAIPFEKIGLSPARRDRARRIARKM